MNFTEAIVRTDGKPGRRGHYYAWARCLVCNDVQLVRRAGLTKRRCVMTPNCPGKLIPADDVADFGVPVFLAMIAFQAEVVDAWDEEVAG